MAPFFLIFLYVLSSPNLFLTTAQETAAVESVVEECVSCDNVLEAERGKFEGLLEKEREVRRPHNTTAHHTFGSLKAISHGTATPTYYDPLFRPQTNLTSLALVARNFNLRNAPPSSPTSNPPLLPPPNPNPKPSKKSSPPPNRATPPAPPPSPKQNPT